MLPQRSDPRGRPLLEWQGGSDNGRASFVALAEDFEQQLGALHGDLRSVAADAEALLLLAQGSLDVPGRRLAQPVFWLPALQLVSGGLQLPGPGFVAPALADYLAIRLRRHELMSSSLGLLTSAASERAPVVA